ncbi:unnamed protein product [Microthlaspi erraticum]|uniref:Uncharacterized protein n=1 Tax=Microthlaspi erraticum TaxID=1685480 RepID=A0A6D2JEV7_9BRAS|nr:unnamed protein product [Microthlaspi erraticum]
MRESSHRPLIFGTPFLSTVGAIFDFPNQRISFNKVNKGMFFPMCSTKNSFVDMVQEEKVTLKPPQEGETEEQSRKIPFLSPSSLPNKQGVRLRPLHQNRPRDQPRLKMRPSQEGRLESLGSSAKGHSWRDCLSSCESPTRYSLQGEKTWRIKDASCLHLLLSAKPYSQAKDLKQALHGRQPMRRRKRCENTIRAKTIGRGRAKKFGRANSNRADRTGRAGKERLCSAGHLARQNRPADARQEGTGRDRPDCIGTDRPPVDPGTNDRPRPISRPVWPTKSLDRDKIHRPSAQTFSAKVSPLFIKFKPVLTNPKPT